MTFGAPVARVPKGTGQRTAPFLAGRSQRFGGRHVRLRFSPGPCPGLSCDRGDELLAACSGLWQISTMRSTIDGAGRIVIPKSLRERLGLKGGETLDIRERDGRIELEPVATPMRLVEGERGAAAMAEGDLPPLTDEIVRETVERTRR